MTRGIHPELFGFLSMSCIMLLSVALLELQRCMSGWRLLSSSFAIASISILPCCVVFGVGDLKI